MQSPTRRTLDGLLAIGPHALDAQIRALTAYAARTGHAIDVFWAILPGEDPATAYPDSGFSIVAFDDDIAGFTAEEYEYSASAGAPEAAGVMDWHVAYAIPQPKSPTTHLPVYGCAEDGEIAADAILCAGPDSLDLQIARIEAYSIRAAIRLRGVYIATGPENLRLLLRDFSASNRTLGTGPTLTVGRRGVVHSHD